MALSDLSFKLYTDDTLSTPYGGISQFVHQSDFSDNPQDILLYFGSTLSNRQLEATSNPGVDNITLTPTDTLPEWAATTAYSVGDTAEPTVDNTFRYEVTTAGTSGGTEPTWPTSVGSTVVDGTVTWTCIAKSHQPTEVKLATTALGLDSATGGAALSLGTTLTGGVANKVEVHMRITNAVADVSTNIGKAEVEVYVNNVTETAV